MKQYSPDTGSQILFEDGERVLCRGWRLGDDGMRESVLLVLPARDRPSRSILDRLTHEYELKDELDGTWALRPLELVHERGRTMLVLEDSGGEPLERLLVAPLQVRHFLHLATTIAGALGKVHRQGLIHKDIKPANILVDRATGTVRVTGFGIASRLTREQQAPALPEFIAGTLAYMAPEQTGRMNRSVDSRSDLYALGVSLYQMLTGTLPFSASDPMEWVHCHIARQPVAPSERLENVPAPLSEIILKLLAKMPEERYQTAAGLEGDLRHCLADWEHHGRIYNFLLGRKDVPDRLLIPEKLYGRARDVETLIACFDRVVKSGAPELVLVSGYSGIGKSSVVNELHKVLVPPRGLFASGKFDQYKRDIPYATLAQAFQSLIRPLLGKSDIELSSWRQALIEALGPNGQLMVDLIPELRLIIGDQAPVPQLPPQDTQRRFQLVIRRFINVFAQPEHPLALFLDDLQWLDVATLDLLEYLATQPELRSLLLVGAYRDNEVTATHPLMRRLAAIRSAGGRVQEIVLTPLRLRDVRRLIAEALRCEPERVAPLARLVHEKAAGNPFFTIQFFTALAEDGLLTFDHAEECWSWDLERIRAKGYTDNVVELMLGKLQRLPTETQHALRLMACLGNSASATSLALLRDGNEQSLHTAMWAAVRAGLVVHLEGLYRFVHDRVHEAAYSLIPAGERASAHLRIGRLLDAHTPAKAIEEHVFEIVSHLNRGSALLTSGAERERLAELNLLAGKRAKAATAYTSALTYFVADEALLGEGRWQRRPELAFALALNRAECEFLTGALAEAENRLTMLSGRAGDLLNLAAVTCLQIELYTTLNRSDRSVEVALDYLRRVDVTWSARPTQDEVRREYERIWQQIGDRPIEALLDLPRMADPVWQATMDVLGAVASPALYTNENLYCLVIGRMANISLEHGNSDASGYGYAMLGIALVRQFGEYEAAFRFGQLGFNLVSKYGLEAFKARVYVILGHHIIPWTRPIRTGRSLLRRALDAAHEAGDLTYGAFGRTHLVTHLLASGDPLEVVQREAEAGLDFARQARFGLVVDRITGQRQLIRTLRGLTPIFGCFDEDEFDEERFEQRVETDPRLALAACWYWIRKLQARVLAGDHAAAMIAAAQADRLLWTSPAFFERAEYHFYAALAGAAICGAAPDAERIRHLGALVAHHRQLLEWAESCPENFENRAALVGAEIARIEGRALDAMDLYEQAIRSARTNNFVHIEALANEVAGYFYLDRGLEKNGYAHLRDARACYAVWGADGKVRQLDRRYPRAVADEHRPTAAMGAPAHQLDLAAVIKASQALSSEIILSKLIERLMTIALENAGADRGLLIAPAADDHLIQAEAKAGGDQPEVVLGHKSITAITCPASLIRYVIRTHERVIVDDVSRPNLFSDDDYLRGRHAKTILCLPLSKQGRLTGLLYLENTLTTHAFTPDRIAVLELLAAQAAISLENTRLYTDLQEREAKVRRLVDSSIIGIYIWELEGNIVDANDTLLRMLACDREDLVSGRLRWLDLTPPEWRDRTAQAIEELKTTGSLQPFEKEYFRKDGSRVPVLIGSVAFDGRRDQGVGFVLDLTERKRAERRLRAQHTVAQILAEAVTIEEATPRILRAVGECLGWDVGAFWRVDPKAAALRCVELWHKTSMEIPEFERVSRESTFDPGLGLPGRVWSSLQPEYVHDVVSDQNFPRGPIAKREELHAALAFPILLGGEALGVIEFFSREIRQPDRELLDVLATIGSQIGQFIERKRAEMNLRDSEEALRRSDAYLAEAQQLSHTGSVAYNDTVNIYWSDETYRIFGFHPIDGLPSYAAVLQRLHPDDRERFVEVARRGVRERTDYKIEFRIIFPGGTIKYIELAAHPKFSAAGTFIEVVGTIIDVTERQRAHDERERLRQLEAELAHMNRLSMMGELTASLAHEITQPFGAARNNARAAINFLNMKPPDLGEVRDAIGSIIDDTERAGNIIERVRDQIKKAHPRMEFFDLNAAINEVIVLAQSSINKNSISMETNFAEGFLPVRGDRVQLQQVVLNLILNAVEAMGSVEKGERTMSISTEQRQANGVLVTVRDSGPGIDRGYLERIFDAFYTTKSSGMGMGLSICRSIINAHGGRLWANANEPRGATFQFVLPKTNDRQGEAQALGRASVPESALRQ